MEGFTVQVGVKEVQFRQVTLYNLVSMRFSLNWCQGGCLDRFHCTSWCQGGSV
jgi:hypothetical protein